MTGRKGKGAFSQQIQASLLRNHTRRGRTDNEDENSHGVARADKDARFLLGCAA